MMPGDTTFANLNDEQVFRLYKMCTFVTEKFVSYLKGEIAQRPAPSDFRLFQTLFPDRPVSAVARFGLLDTLPWEIIREIVLDCDILTVIAISHTSRRGRMIVADIYELRSIGIWASSAIGVAISLKAASYISVRSVFQAMYYARCHVCGQVAEFVQFRPHIVRVCEWCIGGGFTDSIGSGTPITDHIAFTLPQYVSDLARALNRSPSQIRRKMFCMELKPTLCADTIARRALTKRRWVVTGPDARRACYKARVWPLRVGATSRLLARQSTAGMPIYSRQDQYPHAKVSCVACGAALGVVIELYSGGIPSVVGRFKNHLGRCPRIDMLCMTMTTFEPYILDREYIGWKDRR